MLARLAADYAVAIFISLEMLAIAADGTHALFIEGVKCAGKKFTSRVEALVITLIIIPFVFGVPRPVTTNGATTILHCMRFLFSMLCATIVTIMLTLVAAKQPFMFAWYYICKIVKVRQPAF